MSFAVRTYFEWRLRTRTLSLGPRSLVMGILNLTPDSFSDGGQFDEPRSALRQALTMLDEGADILDLGGESTRPGAAPVAPSEEHARVLPVLRAILDARPEAVLSIDTYHAETARLAVEAGAEIVNDVSGHLWDAGMSSVCAKLGCGTVLMHTRGRPQEWRTLPALAPAEVVPFVLRDLEARAQTALNAGVRHASIVLDPGFGFGKILGENYPLLAGFDRLQALGFPLLAGVSRKSFLARSITRNPSAGDSLPSDIWLPTAAANVAAILAGAHILRVHDVRPAVDTAAIADRILQSATAGIPPL
jgi:dihydropteroate synthase